MKKVLTAIVILALLGGGGFAAWWFYFKPPPEETKEASSEGDDATREISTPNSDETEQEAPPASSTVGKAKPGDMTYLGIPKFSDWKGQYNSFLESWTFEKPMQSDGADGADGEIARFYLGRMPPSMPTDMKEYARKLREQPGFQDYGYAYSEVDDTEVYPDGWLILGKAGDIARPDEPPSLSFVMFRTVAGVKVRCRGGSLPTEAIRKEAIQGCRTAAFK